MNTEKPTIYLDLDGVLIDFDGEFERRHGMHPNDCRDDFWGKFNENPTDFYLDAPLYKEAKDFIAFVEEVAEFYEFGVAVLTAVPRMETYPSAASEKQENLNANGLGHLRFIIGPHSKDKQKHCNPGDILIDDNANNIREWMSKGGYGIFHPDGGYYENTKALLFMLLEQEYTLRNDPGF